jgi:uncharacterized protein YggT (Ycf19 family)
MTTGTTGASSGSSNRGAPTPVLRISRVLIAAVYVFATACTIILAMAFFLELFNANEGTPFVAWVLRATERVMQPFRGIFPTLEGERGSLFDPSLLFAMFMYWLLALGTQALIGWIDGKISAGRSGDSSQPYVVATSEGAAPRETRQAD